MSAVRLITITALATVATVGLHVAAPAIAAAQSNPQAEKLFRDGKAQMKAGDVAQACDLFDASQRLEANLATLASLADCREKLGELATAWGLFLAVEQTTRTDPGMAVLHDTAQRRAAALEPRLSLLTINVPDDVRVPGLIVRRDGEPVDAAVWNRAVPIDGGELEIQAEAPGQEPWATKVSVANEGDRKAVEVPRFKELRRFAPPSDDLIDTTAPRVEAEAPDRWTTQRKVAVGASVVGVAAFAVAVYLGVEVRNLEQDAVQLCPPYDCSPANAARANELTEKANRRALQSNVALGVGGAAIAGAVVLWLLGAPDEAAGGPAQARRFEIHPRVGAGSAGVDATLRF